jgi:hypothetical protein
MTTKMPREQHTLIRRIAAEEVTTPAGGRRGSPVGPAPGGLSRTQLDNHGGCDRRETWKYATIRPYRSGHETVSQTQACLRQPPYVE